MDKSKAELLHQLKSMTEYTDQHYEEISEADARSAMTFVNGAWRFLERRRGDRRTN